MRGRSEWCISRQRAWGVPIPVVYDQATDEPLLTEANISHIAGVLEKRGTDYWWEGGAEEFVAPEHQQPGKSWRKGLDTVDVWFDSGVSWSLIRDIAAPGEASDTPSRPIADVYLEGSDQHRGWFQSSLLTAIATAPEGKAVAPYANLISHGFVVDKNGRKMSKSIGNVISPLTMLLGGPETQHPAYGADVLRLWAAKSDYTTDLPVGTLIIKNISDAMRKFRNTARFMLANIPAGKVPPLVKEELSLVRAGWS